MFLVCALYVCDLCRYQVLELAELVFQCGHVDVIAGYIVGVHQSSKVGEFLGDLRRLLLPWLPHLHSFGDHVVLCGEVVPVLCDLLFQGVVVQFDVCVNGLGFLCCFLLPVGLLVLDDSRVT